MPFDPSLPAPNSPLESQVIRDQLQALFNLINNIVTVTAAQVDGVTTGQPGDPAAASVAVPAGTLYFDFTIPRGNDGVQGATGNDGAMGPPGPTGQAGPPFAQAVVDNVNTVSPGSPAVVTVTFDGSNVRFTFDIPQGQPGADGATGAPGEVSNADLQNAMTNVANGSSASTNGVATLDTPFADADAEALRQKVNELLLAARR
jgi:hypothetical protein